MLDAVLVSTPNDVLDGATTTIVALKANPGADGKISLREAILAANGTAGADAITFAAALNGQPLNLTLPGDMTIRETLTITGNGAANTILDGQQKRIFLVPEGDLTLDGLTLRNGLATFGGGAILFLSSGTLAVHNSTLSGNSTASNGAAGGAIASTTGAVEVSNSTLSGNSTAGTNAHGGAIFSGSGAVTVSNSTLTGNSTAGASAKGGAISSEFGAVIVINSTLTGNFTTGSAAVGGAIATSGALTVINSTLSGNSTVGTGARGGAIRATNFAVTVSNSTLTGNSTAGESAKGGAISSEFGAVTVSNSTLTGNSTAGEIAAGGAIQTVYGALTVIDSTLWRNFTTGPAANGGAVQSDQGAVTVINSTLTGNSTANGNGGAIDTGGPGVVTATVTNSTVAFNRAPNGLGGGICSQSVPVILNNSIVARNSDNGTAPDLLPTTDPVNDPLTVRYSLIGNNTGTGLAEAQPPNPGINGNFIGSAANPIDPLLGPLTNNGGPTLTHALLAGSPALNRGNNGLAFDPQTLLPLVNDQRGPGFARRLGSVDMGAFEMQSSPLGGQMPPPPLGGQARGIIAALVSKKVKKSRRLFVRVSFADTGALKSEVRSPFNRPAFRRIVVSVFDSNGDGLADTVRLTARKGKKTLTRLLAL